MVIVFICEDGGDGNRELKGCGCGKIEDSEEGFIIR
jgi:hypothetical protein